MNEQQRMAVINFLTNHEKYNTMSSWNNQKSYSRNVKLNQINIPRKYMDAAYNLLNQEWFFDDLRCLFMDEFQERWDHNYTMGFNGRSSGYIVLYKNKWEKQDYKTRCNKCWKPTWYDKEQPCHMPGCSGTLKLLTKPIFIDRAGGGVNYDKDILLEYDDWGLLNLLELIVDFNRTIDDMLGHFISICKDITDEKINVETGDNPDA